MQPLIEHRLELAGLRDARARARGRRSAAAAAPRLRRQRRHVARRSPALGPRRPPRAGRRPAGLRRRRAASRRGGPILPQLDALRRRGRRAPRRRRPASRAVVVGNSLGGVRRAARGRARATLPHRRRRAVAPAGFDHPVLVPVIESDAGRPRAARARRSRCPSASCAAPSAQAYRQLAFARPRGDRARGRRRAFTDHHRDRSATSARYLATGRRLHARARRRPFDLARDPRARCCSSGATRDRMVTHRGLAPRPRGAAGARTYELLEGVRPLPADRGARPRSPSCCSTSPGAARRRLRRPLMALRCMRSSPHPSASATPPPTPSTWSSRAASPTCAARPRGSSTRRRSAPSTATSARRRPRRAARLPVLLVPPLAAPTICFDLRRGCSMAEHMLGARPPDLPRRVRRNRLLRQDLGLEHWVEDVIPTAIRAGLARTPAASRCQLVGWCLGGIMSLLARRRRPDAAGQLGRDGRQPVRLHAGAADGADPRRSRT